MWVGKGVLGMGYGRDYLLIGKVEEEEDGDGDDSADTATSEQPQP